MACKLKPNNLFRWFDGSPNVIQLTAGGPMVVNQDAGERSTT
jgi:hypothetical protein